MTELVMTTEAEVEDFTDELSDEALDRAEGAFVFSNGIGSVGGPFPLSRARGFLRHHAAAAVGGPSIESFLR